MAQNITLQGASYTDVPAVNLPKTGGGTAQFTDTSDTTATASQVFSGYYFYNSQGVRTVGTGTGGATLETVTVKSTTTSQTIAPSSGYDGFSEVTVDPILLQEKTVTPTESVITVIPDSGSYTNTLYSSYAGSGTIYWAWTPPTLTNGNTYGFNVTWTRRGKSRTQSYNGNVTWNGFGSTTVTLSGAGSPVLTFGENYITTNGSDEDMSNDPLDIEISGAGENYDGLSSVEVAAISSSYVGSGIQRQASSNLYVTNATVYVPAGYYSVQASKAVSSGSVTAPSTISGTGASVTVGTNTLTLSKTISVTPNVTSAGYISSGTAANASVSLAATVTTKAAATVYPSSADQSISANQYLSGAQTIKAVTTSNLAAANIKSGIIVKVGDSNDDDRITSVTGTFTSDATATASDIISGKSAYVGGSKVDGSLVIQHYYTGTAVPSAGLGVNGDIYLKTS